MTSLFPSPSVSLNGHKESSFYNYDYKIRGLKKKNVYYDRSWLPFLSRRSKPAAEKLFTQNDRMKVQIPCYQPLLPADRGCWTLRLSSCPSSHSLPSDMRWTHDLQQEMESSCSKTVAAQEDQVCKVGGRDGLQLDVRHDDLVQDAALDRAFVLRYILLLFLFNSQSLQLDVHQRRQE